MNVHCLCVQVFRYDSPAPLVRCFSIGDPHVTTFDGLYYHIYTTGNFIYVRSQSHIPAEVSLICISMDNSGIIITDTIQYYSQILYHINIS